MPENTQPDYVGMDIAAERLDYCVNETTEGHCTNDSAGRAELIAKVKLLPHPRIICEASGGYEKLVVAELLAAGIEVCVVQPARVRAFACAEGLLAKTESMPACCVAMPRKYSCVLPCPSMPH